MDAHREELIGELMRRLEIDHQYTEDIPAYDDDRIDMVRSCCRVAARRLGWKVRTMAFDRASGYTRVIAVVIESTPEDQARLDERARQAWMRMMESLE